ncbi:MAG TPA: chemotaxis protein CheX [Syntrophomonadaceae bacterium]|nr:chemotaxis protein CheX [Syntrophomonadaceae bacterium]
MEMSAQFAPFVKATIKILKDMLGFQITNGDNEKEADIFTSRGFAVMVGFTGGWKGRLILDMPGETAMKMASSMTGEVYSGAGEEEVLLSGAELGNIIGGNAITEVNNSQPGLKIRLTPPSVFSGDEMTFFNARLSSWSVLLNTDAGPVKLNVAIEGA